MASNKRRKTHPGQVKALLKVGELDYVVDDFDPNVKLDRRTDICCLCKQGHLGGLELMKRFKVESEIDDEDGEEQASTEVVESALSFEDPTGVWASRFSLASGGKSKRRIFVHHYCAYFSPQIWFTGTIWHNLIKEVRRGGSLECKHCRQRGATLGCVVDRCSVVVHIPCALQLGFAPNDLSEVVFHCADHRAKRAQSLKQLDAESSNDVSRGRETIPITIPMTIGSVPFFEYITSNIDSDDVVASIQNIADVACCNCTGLCNDMNTCQCLQYQRNYSNHGVLMASSSKPIIECNLKCGCSVRRCTNRVVQRGPQVRLKLVEKALTGVASGVEMGVKRKAQSSLHGIADYWDLQVRRPRCGFDCETLYFPSHVI